MNSKTDLDDHPYSDTVESNGIVFVSGCLPVDEDDNVVTDFDGVLDAALRKLELRLAGAGLTLADVVKLTYFATDIELRELANRQYEATWDTPRPARSFIGVPFLPKGAMVEIDAIARKPAGA